MLLKSNQEVLEGTLITRESYGSLKIKKKETEGKRTCVTDWTDWFVFKANRRMQHARMLTHAHNKAPSNDIRMYN